MRPLKHTYEATLLCSDVNLVSVYDRPGAIEVLYDLLKERDEKTNISHKELPAWCDHLKFVASRPYQHWWLICSGRDFVPYGACYLSKTNEIGVFVFKRWRGMGLGRAAIQAVMKECGPRRYLANINPQNEHSAELFKSLGFKLIQHTYEAAA
jgi:GNAT superfamily N-acetyltransferase